MVYCPKCSADISDTYEGADPSVGIEAGFYCGACDLGVAEWEVEREPLEGDVPIMTAKEACGDRPFGTPISALSGRPGPMDDMGHPDHARFQNFKRIARSWGYD